MCLLPKLVQEGYLHPSHSKHSFGSYQLRVTFHLPHSMFLPLYLCDFLFDFGATPCWAWRSDLANYMQGKWPSSYTISWAPFLKEFCPCSSAASDSQLPKLMPCLYWPMHCCPDFQSQVGKNCLGQSVIPCKRRPK